VKKRSVKIDLSDETGDQKRYPIKPEFRAAMVTRLVRIIADPNSSNREVVDASKALIAAEKENRIDEQNGSIDEQRSRIVEIVERIRSRAIGVDSTNQEIERIDEK